MVSEARNLQDVVHGRVADPARLPLTSRDVGAPRERLRATGVAGKWRRNRLKRLNPRREMVWSRKPLTYKIWYTRAADHARLRLRSCKNDKGCWLPPLCETNRDGTPMMKRVTKRTGIVSHASCEREPIFVLQMGAARDRNSQAARQISCQSCVVVLYLFSRHRPGGDRRADRRSFEPRRFVADGKTESPGNGAATA